MKRRPRISTYGRCIYCGGEVEWRSQRPLRIVRGHEIPRWNGSGPVMHTTHRNCYLKAILGKRWRHHKEDPMRTT